MSDPATVCGEKWRAPQCGARDAMRISLGPITLSTSMSQLEVPRGFGNAIEIKCRASGAQLAEPGAALVAVEFDGPVSAEILSKHGLYLSAAVGPFAYLAFDPADHGRFTVRFTIPPGLQLVGLTARLWNSEAPIDLWNLVVIRSVAHPQGREILVNLSVDVEALPHRAPANHVDRLIYGRFDGVEQGLPAELRLFEELGVPATFYLEVGECAVHGDGPVLDAGRLIRDTGFDLQLHLHSEVLVRAQNWPWSLNVSPNLANLDIAQTRAAMQYAVSKYDAVMGRLPDGFRAGGFLFNPHLVRVASELGIACLSNFRADWVEYNAYQFDGAPTLEPFRWADGPYEFPITIALDPLTKSPPEEVWTKVLRQIERNKTWLVTMVIHSWSLLARAEDGFQVYEGPQYLDALRRLIETAPKCVKFASIGEIRQQLDRGAIPLPIVERLDRLRPNAA
jgi:hypothetical protein